MLTPITIIQHPQLGPAVSGRELYNLITESKAAKNIFSDWFREREQKLSLAAGIDFLQAKTIVPEMSTTRQQIEFILSLEAAKRICTIQQKKRGLGVLAFIEAYELNPTLSGAIVTAPAPSVESVATSPEIQFEQPMTPTQTPPPAEPQALPLSPGQLLLQQAQQLLEEETRIKAEQAEREAKAKAVPTPVEVPPALEARLSITEQKVNTLLSFFTQAYQALQELSPAEIEQAPEDTTAPTTRGLLCRLVNSYASATRQSEHDTWKYLYGQFDLRNGFNVYSHAPGKGERNYLSIIERYKHMENLYVLARKLLVLPELK